ncbi:MAG TPA: site-specific integrase [Candidatus Binataceae bacterium]|nr:site-specific integrase [Candidatus Binataceae bacterium]
MSVFRRGRIYWYKFKYRGIIIRESAHSPSKNLARELERARHREIERTGVVKKEPLPPFPIAAKAWLDKRVGLAPGTVERYAHHVKTLSAEFRNKLVSDLHVTDVEALRQKRRKDGLKPRSINYEVGTLAQILKSFGCWASIGERIRGLRESRDIGKAVSLKDERVLLAAIGQNDSPALLPLFTLTIDTGLRAAEARSLRWRDLELSPQDGSITSGRLIVPKSKTVAGKGRTIPLTKRVCAILSLWRARFADATADSFVFPKHRVACRVGGLEHHVYGVDLNASIGSWRRSWRSVNTKAQTNYRWHDLRHTFVSRLAENPNVSEQTIMSLAGHVSKQMLARYSHIRQAAKADAIAALESHTEALSQPEITPEGAQLWAQSAAEHLN